MNTLVAVSIAPFGVGDELSNEVAQVIKVIRSSKLPQRTSAMFTEIEGTYDEVMDLIKRATQVLVDKNIRTYVSITMDIRPGFENTINEKIRKVEELLGDENAQE